MKEIELWLLPSRARGPLGPLRDRGLRYARQARADHSQAALPGGTQGDPLLRGRAQGQVAALPGRRSCSRSPPTRPCTRPKPAESRSAPSPGRGQALRYEVQVQGRGWHPRHRVRPHAVLLLGRGAHARRPRRQSLRAHHDLGHRRHRRRGPHLGSEARLLPGHRRGQARHRTAAAGSASLDHAWIWRYVSGNVRGGKRQAEDSAMLLWLDGFQRLLARFSDGGSGSWAIEEVRVNPLAISDERHRGPGLPVTETAPRLRC